MQPGSGTSFDHLGVPAGALRILSRRSDSEVLILHGEGRAADVDAGEHLAWVERLPSIEIAAAMSRFFSWHLLRTFPPDAYGWHPFAVQHLKTLVSLARAGLNVTYFPAQPDPRERQAWTAERNAWLGYLIGQGWDAKRIAEDPLIRSTPGMVYRQAHKLGLSFTGAAANAGLLRLPATVRAAYDRATARQGLQCDALIRRVVIAAAADLDRMALVG